MDIQRIQDKDVRVGIGLMSGTSCDGIDAALVKLRGTGADLCAELVAFETFAYGDAFRERLLAGGFTEDALCTLHWELGALLADAAETLAQEARERGLEVDFVASHGHTLAHQPPPQSSRAGTLQLGEAAVIAERLGCLVVSDFRPNDLAAGGQGAPLVPYADWVLFRREKENVAALNIGGIANFTVVTPDLDQVYAFDTGPGNMIIDGAMGILTDGEARMDEDGAAAARGTVAPTLLERLLAHPYFDRTPPKSTGREDFGSLEYLLGVLTEDREQSADDIMATVTAAVARSIAEAFQRFIVPETDVTEVIVGGGGASNPTLMDLLRKELAGVAVRPMDDFGVPSDVREAMAFAILGNETLCGTASNVPKATGARRPVVLGKVTWL